MTDLKKHFNGCLFLCLALILFGCDGPEKGEDSAFLIKTASIIITSSDFIEELDLKRAAYPYDIDENPVRYNEMVIDLVRTLSREILLLTAAADKGIIVTDKEAGAAEDEFKKMYPGDSFKQVLIKNAISYPLWKKRFKENMIMDKLIDQELKQKIEINAQDLVEFYKKYQMSDIHNNSENTIGLNRIDNEKELVFRLRLQKSQEQYDEWIQNLSKDYPVQINNEKLKIFLMAIEKSEGNKNEKNN